MKISKLCTTLAVSAFCLMPWLHSTKANAGTVTLTLEDLGPGNNSGGVYTYPYNFSVNGSPTETSLMCYIYANEIYVGETWTANVVQITADSSTDIKELAYLDSIAANSGSSATDVSAAQWAAWELFDQTDFPGQTGAPDAFPGQTAVSAQLTAAANFINTVSPDFYDNYDLYIPVEGSQTPGDGTPQSFVGDPAPTPEPGSLVLMGSGLMVCAIVLMRKGRSAQAIRA